MNDEQFRLHQRPEHRTVFRTWQRSGVVLIIDDDATIRSTIAQLVAQLGLISITAATGATGLALLRQDTIMIGCMLLDLSLTDVQIASIIGTGRTAIPALPIIVMAEQTTQEITQLVGSIQINGILLKPFSKEALHDCLAQALNRQV